jgi:hypothetical protein
MHEVIYNLAWDFILGKQTKNQKMKLVKMCVAYNLSCIGQIESQPTVKIELTLEEAVSVLPAAMLATIPPFLINFRPI